MRNLFAAAFVLSAELFISSPVAAQVPGAAQSSGTGLPDQIGPAFGGVAVPAPGGGTGKGEVAVTTYHYDNLRTGWNNHEPTLTPANVNPDTFGLLSTIPLDDQVDAQPLLVPNQMIVKDGVRSKHDVVYVVTESNTVYAIDASGQLSPDQAILLSANLGSPVPRPFGCVNSGPNIGITGTPVIDLASRTLYVVAYVNGDNGPSYQLHALDLSDLSHKRLGLGRSNPRTIAASHVLTDDSTVEFEAQYQRQRVGLIELNGNVYAGFAGFCDFEANHTRGWLLEWNARTLAPLPANQLNNRRASTPPTNFFLSTIWMSGWGIAGHGTDLYFSTGNSDCVWYVSPVKCPDESTYDGVTYTNIQNSVVRISSNLTKIRGIYTPTNVLDLDHDDEDLGSGGVMLLPLHYGKSPVVAAASAKDGHFYLLDPLAMGTPIENPQLSPCWCGPSYFQGSDGISRIVTSHGQFVHTWQVQLSQSPHLIEEGLVAIAGSSTCTSVCLGFTGFFTAVSSDGTKPGTAIIWAVGRPGADPGDPTAVHLHAFDPVANSDKSLNELFSTTAGHWPNTGGNSNIVPVVANGRVYVASAFLDDQGTTRGQLAIFGLGGASATVAQKALHPSAVASLEGAHVVTGPIEEVSDSTLTLKTRAGKSVKVDISQAMKQRRVKGPLRVGQPFTVQASSLTAAGALLATSIAPAKGSFSEGVWPPDK